MAARKLLKQKYMKNQNNMQSILYIHGFNSAGNAWKAMKLIEYFPDYEIVSPTLDYYTQSPDALIAQLKHEIDTHDIRMIVGTSLGGMMTMYMSALCGLKALAINPASRPNESLRQFVGVELINYATETKHYLSQEAFDAYQGFITGPFNDVHFDSEKITFALAKDDELLGSYDSLKEQFRGFTIHEFDKVTHRFVKFEYLVPIIRDILES